MSEIYTVIVGILGILAVSGLFVGVTNDAVNFLNSAIGSKAASMKVILTVASVGIIIGVVTSSGMMEVARSGMFNPGLFTFHEVMMLYLGVMFANVILLDLYNSWGLPTSTTVSLIFCLLGAAIAVSIYKISNDPEQGVSALGQYINTSRAMGIVSAILLSVVIAFTCGTPRHVRLAHDLLVPLHGALPPLRIALVRSLADGDRLFRRLQRDSSRCSPTTPSSS